MSTLKIQIKGKCNHEHEDKPASFDHEQMLEIIGYVGRVLQKGGLVVTMDVDGLAHISGHKITREFVVEAKKEIVEEFNELIESV